ncbi:DUF2087 domain-containing protein [Streptomyces marianii]|uniref:DUF2087 domain-containing protein n=1 Tax=Streptomyces marianii TaxID=1817406 RepID=A0A5R9E5N1_9ACTN|nr:DUF2087 domain-containing protein [Streptomyces marianii]TLQ43564.1 DUF2087 domain-containing protein [Streptomyces marianii]
MSYSEPGGSRDVSALFSRGRLTAVPRKAARRRQLLDHPARTLFGLGREYSEREVNDAVRTVHDDCSALRRYPVEARLLTRARDGSAYRRAA